MIEDSEVAVFSCARLASQRCKNKMVRKFGDTTLLDILLSKLKSISSNTFFSGHESIFEERSKFYKVDFIPRSFKSGNSEVASEIYNFLEDVDYKYLLCINGCQPFLKRKTIEDFLSKCIKTKRPTFAVFKRNNYFMDMNNNPFNYDPQIKTINTKFVQPVREFAHVFYFYERDYFLKNGVYWDWKEVDYVEIPHGIESLDIDSEEDFDMARLLWENKEVRERYIDY